ncbi:MULTISPECIES: winged helix-turn-helix transcriptional regulator [Caproicibacterium]|uniref:Winged helix-turn-helix transcriptional regulator n=1 Tax=Caproicibacterium argilliputei TaxID=3030016 RepID=A0AA97H230_9FIRM|nr:winged helix-turn-helix transcriptional regulator [Caproicibacterium argilliputei]WOC32325.1 winged helix-turn-helix transcriptional regulator [Caproicibacterium argilliputei]
MKKDKSKEKKSKKRLREQPTAPAPLTALPAQKQDALLCRALEAVGGKWKLRVLFALGSGKDLRYSEIRGSVAGITDMMLSQSLRELCAAGLAERKQFQQIPPRVEYHMTEKAAGALEAAALLCTWAKQL